MDEKIKEAWKNLESIKKCISISHEDKLKSVYTEGHLAAQAEHDAEVGELVEALSEALEEEKETIDAIGGCDHEVGICCCDLANKIDRHEKLLASYHQIDCPECGGSEESIDVDSRSITICLTCNKGKVWWKK